MRSFIKERFSLRTGKDAGQHTITEAINSSSIKGANLWILLLAIIICSVGLNINSSAVVIWAMLISPLMWPVIGIGIWLAIYDTSMVIQWLKNLLVAFILSLIVSGIYFLLSPLDQTTAEITARMSPTIRDIIVAFCGWLAGAIALTRKEKSLTFIPWVAIATALMPPLCVTGYWLIQWNLVFAATSFYLLCINCVFISGATFFIARLIRLPKKEYPTPAHKRKVQIIIWLIIIFTAIPSTATTINIVEQTLRDQQIRHLTQDITSQYNIQIIDKTIDLKKKKIWLRIVGPHINDEQRDNLVSLGQQYSHLKDYTLSITQWIENDPNETQNIVKPLLSDALESQEAKIIKLINQSLVEFKSTLPPETSTLYKELASLEENIIGLDEVINSWWVSYQITTQSLLSLKEKEKIENWLKTRIENNEIIMTWKNI